MTQQDQSRAAFEAEYAKRHEVYDTTFIYYELENRYQRPAVDEAWWAWQAAIAHDRKQRNLKERAQLDAEWVKLREMPKRMTLSTNGQQRGEPDTCGFVAVKESAVDWLKMHYPALCEKSGLCERVAGRLRTITRLATPQPAEPDESPLPPPGLHYAPHYATFLRREASKLDEPARSAMRQAGRMIEILNVERVRLVGMVRNPPESLDSCDSQAADAARWQKAKRMPRQQLISALSEAARKGGRSLEGQIDAYQERRLP